MIKLLTEIQKDLLIGKKYADNSFFNPIQDINENWCLSLEEVQYCTNTDFDWIKVLPEIEYIPKITENIFIHD